MSWKVSRGNGTVLTIPSFHVVEYLLFITFLKIGTATQCWFHSMNMEVPCHKCRGVGVGLCLPWKVSWETPCGGCSSPGWAAAFSLCSGHFHSFLIVTLLPVVLHILKSPWMKLPKPQCSVQIPDSGGTPNQVVHRLCTLKKPSDKIHIRGLQKQRVSAKRKMN